MQVTVAKLVFFTYECDLMASYKLTIVSKGKLPNTCTNCCGHFVYSYSQLYSYLIRSTVVVIHKLAIHMANYKMACFSGCGYKFVS